MPALAGTKRVKGLQVHRPFIFGSIATPLDPAKPCRAGIPAEHTHQWTVYLRPITPEHDVTHWLKKVQFKLHETYANSSRMVEAPGPFEVTETGWGEFEVQLKLYFVPEANEKAATIWHALKLHPYGPRAEEMREKREPVVSQCYEEILFTEPVEAFLETLTHNHARAKGKLKKLAELPPKHSKDVLYSSDKEASEVSRLTEADRKVHAIIEQEKAILADREKKRDSMA